MDNGTVKEMAMKVTKYQECVAACSGQVSEYLEGYVDGAFANDFRPGRMVGGSFLSYDNGSLRYEAYRDGFLLARQKYTHTSIYV